MIIAAYFLSFIIRSNLAPTPPLMVIALNLFLPVVLGQFCIFVLMGTYHRIWRYSSLHDLWHLVQTIFIAQAASVAIVYMLIPISGMPRSVLIIDGLLLLFFLGGGRFFYRAWSEGLHKRSHRGPRTLIVGAGRTGSELLRSLQSDKKQDLHIVGLIDDDPMKQGGMIFGVPVLGTVESLEKWATARQVEQVLIAVPSASGKQIQRILNHCEQVDVIVKTMPSYSQLASGAGLINEMRPLEIGDLLNRGPIELDTTPIQRIVTHKTVLVTGAGGSIGSELCRQIMRFSPKRLILLDNSEYFLYRIDGELSDLHPGGNFTHYLAHVRDASHIDQILSLEKPDIILHAAAYKHVPLMEMNPRAAVLNNIEGTLVMARAANDHGVGKFVLISTDKAVNPTNIMGATKRVAELACRALQVSGGKTQFITVRFGNVLASNGSVVPRFLEQIRAGGPVTITHPEITRFFMSINEAALLVLTASAIGRGGEIFVLDMGEQIKIIDLARALIKLQGKIPGRDIPITFTGLRPGEKLFEELFRPEELLATTDNRKIFVARSRECSPNFLDDIGTLLSRAEASDPETNLREMIARLVPEYAWQKEVDGNTPSQANSARH